MRDPKITITCAGRIEEGLIPTIMARCSEYRWWVIAWLVANIGDCVSTFMAIHRGGAEANFLVNAVLSHGGGAFLVFKIGFTLLVLACIMYTGKHVGSLKFCTVLLSLVVISNVYCIYLLGA